METSKLMGGGVGHAPGYLNDREWLIRDTIGRATIFLDDQNWYKWLDLCTEDFQYSIRSWSPEIRYDMTYLQAGKKDLVNLIRLLPKHNTDNSPLSRHTVVCSVDIDPSGETAQAVSSMVVFQHLLDGTNSHIDSGESRLFLVGKYYDTFRFEEGNAQFLTREVRLQNRRLDKGSHWPI